MASTTMSNPSSSSHAAKKLGELLQLQQEPFTLEIFLLERAYLTKKLKSESSFFKSSSKWKFYKRRKAVPYCSKIVKEVLNKVLHIGNKQRTDDPSTKGGNRGGGGGDFGGSKQEKEDTGKVSSPSSPKGIELDEDREEDKQLSPVSVLEGIPSVESSPVMDNSKQRHSKLSKFSMESPKKVAPAPSVQAPKQANPNPELSSQNLAAKRVLQKSKQLLFDCVKELVEDRRGGEFVEFMGAEEVGKLFQTDVAIWSNLSGRETNTTRLLRFDFQETVPEWRDCRPQTRDVGTAIADDILDDMSREIVVDMFELDRPRIFHQVTLTKYY